MNIEDYKKKIHFMVDEIMDYDFILKIYTVTIVVYRKFKAEGNK